MWFWCSCLGAMMVVTSVVVMSSVLNSKKKKKKKSPLGVMDTIVTKRIPFFFYTHLGSTFSISLLFPHSCWPIHLQNGRPSLFSPSKRYEKQKPNGDKQKAESHDNLIRSVLSCPFWPVSRLFAGLKLTRSEWIEICVDVCALNAKIWRGRREWVGGRGGGGGRVGGGIKRRPTWLTVSISSWTLNSSLHLQ